MLLVSVYILPGCSERIGVSYQKHFHTSMYSNTISSSKLSYTCQSVSWCLLPSVGVYGYDLVNGG